MHHPFALMFINVWLVAMIYGWATNRNGETDRQNYDQWRWMLCGQSREHFLRQRRWMHRLTLPFAVGFYLLAMWGILSTA